MPPATTTLHRGPEAVDRPAAAAWFEAAAPWRPPLAAGEPRIEVHDIATDEERRAELRQGLLAPSATISPKFFYDPQGSALYDALCRLDEYVPPRLEAQLFDRHQREIADALPRGGQWIDLGCGDGAKALRWLAATGARRYVGVDIAPDWLRDTLRRGADRLPGVSFEGVVTDFVRSFDLRPMLDERPELARSFFYPGSSIGNFEPADAVRLLARLRAHLRPQDRLLIGVDGPKPVAQLVAAYDDALGVTAAFNRNVLRVANRELGADFDPAAFDHEALWDAQQRRIEMRLRTRRAQTVRLGRGADAALRRFEAGESILTEYSHKHAPEDFAALLVEAGLTPLRHWSEAGGAYSVFVAAAAGAHEGRA